MKGVGFLLFHFLFDHTLVKWSSRLKCNVSTINYSLHLINPTALGHQSCSNLSEVEVIQGAGKFKFTLNSTTELNLSEKHEISSWISSNALFFNYGIELTRKARIFMPVKKI